MIVVGGLDSANTRRLAEISSACGTPTYHVETEAQLDVDALLRYRKVGLTAGASTPNWMIKRVIRRLEDEHGRRGNLAAFPCAPCCGGWSTRTSTRPAPWRRWRSPAWVCCVGAGREALCMAVAFCFVLGQHLLNQSLRRLSLYLSEPSRADFFLAHEGKLLALAVGSALGALALALLVGPGVLL